MGGCRLPRLLPLCLDLYVWGQKTGLPVTDRDECLGAAGLSQSVTFRGLENGLLLQIETFGVWLGECLNL